MDSAMGLAKAGEAAAAARRQSSREVASACLGVSFVLGLVGLGVALSGGNPILAVAMGAGWLVFLCAFGITWDMQSPNRKVGGSNADGAAVLLASTASVGPAGSCGPDGSACI